MHPLLCVCIYVAGNSAFDWLDSEGLAEEKVLEIVALRGITAPIQLLAAPNVVKEMKESLNKVKQRRLALAMEKLGALIAPKGNFDVSCCMYHLY